MSGPPDRPPYQKAFRTVLALNFLLLAALGALWWSIHEKKIAAASPETASPALANPAAPPPAENPAGSAAPFSPAGGGKDEPPLAPVQLSPERLQSIGIRFTTVRSRLANSEIRATGNVEINERQVSYIQTKVSGWLRQVFADATYEYVQKGQPLYSIYSPDIVNTEQDYVLAQKSLEAARGSTVPGVASGAQSLLSAAILRLTQWDVPAAEIQRLAKTGRAVNDLIVESPVSGYITERNALVNVFVQPETRLFTIADLSTVWVVAQVFQTDMGQIKPGDPVSVTVDAYPGRTFRGQVDSIIPQVDMSTRTARVRIVLFNPDFKLAPGMFVNVELKNSLGRRTVVPSSAIFQSGTRQIVFVNEGEGRLTPREVQTGPQVTLAHGSGAAAGSRVDSNIHEDEMIVVTHGLKPGESIVSSANFLIDSESQLQAAAEALAPPPAMEAENSSPAAQAAFEFSSDPAPPRKGANLFRVKLTGKDGAPVTGAQVDLTFSMAAMPAMGMPAMKTIAHCADSGAGLYVGHGDLASGGSWQVTLAAQKDGRTIARKQFSVNASGGM